MTEIFTSGGGGGGGGGESRDLRAFLEGEAYVEAYVLPSVIDGLGNPFLDTYQHFRDLNLRDDDFMLLHGRRRLVKWFAWAVPTEGTLALVGAAGSVVEVGAGGGYWAAMLRARGVEVFAYDPNPGRTIWSEKVWTDVEVAGASAAGRHPEATLLLCWPPYASRMALVALRRYLRAGGKRVAYIGERGGCTADEAFEDAFAALEGDDADEKSFVVPQFPGMHDGLFIVEVA